MMLLHSLEGQHVPEALLEEGPSLCMRLGGLGLATESIAADVLDTSDVKPWQTRPPGS